MATFPPLPYPTQKKFKSPAYSHFIPLIQNSKSAIQLSQIHAQLLKSSLIENPLFLTKLLLHYSTFNHAHALKLFSVIIKPDFLHWNTLIHGFSVSQAPGNSISMYVNLIKDDPSCLDAYTFPSVLKSCSKISAFDEGVQIHCQAIKYCVVSDIFVQNSLMHMYFACGRWKDARRVFDNMRERNVVSWNCLIGGYIELDFYQDVICLFKDMISESTVVPNSVTLVRVITACSKLRDCEVMNLIGQYIIENEIDVCLNLGNALMHMYAKFGDMEKAKKLFDEMSERDVCSWTTLVSGYANFGNVEVARDIFDLMPTRNYIAWNAMIAGYVHNGGFREAVLLYEEMLVHNVTIDKATLLSALSACARSDNTFTGRTIHAQIYKLGISTTIDLHHSILGIYTKSKDMTSAELLFNKMTYRNVVSYTIMITGYVNSGAKGSALHLFTQMPEKDVASWNALITALAQNNHFNEALEIFKDMLKNNFVPNCLTFSSTLSACARVGSLESGRWIHAYIERNNIDIDAQVYSSLIDMYAKCGQIDISLDIFNKTHNKNVSTWSTMIGACAMCGRCNQALVLFEQMVNQGLKPDDITFVGVLSACSHSGLKEDGMRYFNLMTETYKIVPSTEHYGCIVDLFSRLGHLKEAKEFIESVDVSSDGEAAWMAFLSACNVHGDVELAEYAMKTLLKNDRAGSGAYVMMSNVYAKNLMWDEVGKLRKMMRRNGVRKVPGCSSIEVDGVVHEFFVGDSLNVDRGFDYVNIYGVE